ncbi:MAG: alpha/beta hydrolase [Parahaliea sp.]
MKPVLPWRVLPTLAICLATGLSACGDSTARSKGPRADASGQLLYGQISFEPSALRGAAGQNVEAHCASLEVPENYDAPEGRRIALALALLPANGVPQEDPVVMIAGGPGQAALESYPTVQAAFSDVQRNRHVLLLDARGTGGSNPLHCELADDDTLFANPARQTPETTRAMARRCRDSLSGKADLRFYTTGNLIRDLDHVRQQLAVDRLNLVGISYGTRVAQQYAARYPQHTRSLVLDSVVPNSLVLGQDHARNLEQALDALFARCRQDSACGNHLGDPRQHLTLVRERLWAGDIAPVRYRDPVSGEWHEETPHFGHLAGLLRMYAYQPEMAATLPLLLHEAAQQRYDSLLAQSRMLSSELGDILAAGMSLSVTCSEDAGEFRSDSGDSGTVLGTQFITISQASCADWPKGQRAADFRNPLTGDLPVLAISGEYDPVTPPRYGEEVIRHLSAGRHLVLPGRGHSVLGAGCMPKLFARFIETADAASLDATCLNQLSARPPFAGNYGWEP